MEIVKLNKISQSQVGESHENFSQFFSGDVPDYLGNLIGTPNVDISRITGSFSGSSKAIEYVNKFNGSLLTNISVIFNSSDSGSYGVYVPALDKAIKTKALKKILEQKGYEIKDENGMMMAYSKDNKKTQEQVSSDIKSIYSSLEKSGGTVFGLNMGKILSAAKEDANNIILQNQQGGEKGNVGVGYQKLFELFSIIHLGSTIVHEAIHAKGSTGEGPSEQGEEAFRNWLLPQINSQYQEIIKSMGFNPNQNLVLKDKTRHANAKSWYKKAQNYFPSSGGSKPVMEDFKGKGNTKGVQDWAMRSRSPYSDNIENKLSREFMSKLPSDLSQEHDSLEIQLRKYTRDSFKLDSTLIFEELLAKDYDTDDVPYKSTEELMEESRTKPLLKVLNKKASKEVLSYSSNCAFGYMNNLAVSDGNTIPGLGDRVMLFDDRQEDFDRTNNDIRQQPRYNPEYDFKGFYYRWIDLHLVPQLYYDMSQDYSNTHPAKRFASKENADNFTSICDNIKSILSNIRGKVISKDIKATRLIASKNLYNFVIHYLNSDKLKVDVFYINRDENMMSFWVYNLGINSDDIEDIEYSIQNKEMDDIEDKLKDLLMSKNNNVQEVINIAEKICDTYDFEEIYVVGAYAREKFFGNSQPDVNELCFNCCSEHNNMKFGSIMAEKLGVDMSEYDNGGIYFYYKGLKIEFLSGCKTKQMKKMLHEKGIECNSEFLLDLYNRDFTINMAAYNVCNKDISFPANDEIPNIGVLETFFSPEILISNNPVIILRALYFNIKYNFSFSKELDKAIIYNSPLLLRDNVDVCDIVYYLLKENSEKTKKLFAEYGLEKLLEKCGG